MSDFTTDPAVAAAAEACSAAATVYAQAIEARFAARLTEINPTVASVTLDAYDHEAGYSFLVTHVLGVDGEKYNCHVDQLFVDVAEDPEIEDLISRLSFTHDYGSYTFNAARP